jgi:signal recognition particle subunit SRP9
MYIENIDSFLQQAESLYKANPLRTRYVVKYRHVDGKLSVKVTDDFTCLKYKTNQQSDLKKVERLNNLLFHLMATGEEPQADVDTHHVEQLSRSKRKG